MSVILFCSKSGKYQIEFTIKNVGLMYKESWEQENVLKVITILNSDFVPLNES